MPARFAWIAVAALAATPAVAQEEELTLDNVDDVSAQEALNTSTKVASSSARSLRDSPGIVTVINRDEIQRSGARDLLDVLHLVAGFSFGVDVQGSVGPIFRGVWGQEGKVLVLWDGMEMNEGLFLTTPIENHFPIHAIEKIEIIRGPGSSLYGGMAELAVINITSRGAARQGVEVTGQYGQMATSFGRAVGGLGYGQTFRGGFFDGLQLSADLYGGEAVRSDREFNDGYGNSYKTGYANSRTSPTWLQARAAWKGLEVQTLVDLFRVTQRDNFDVALDEAVNNSYYSAFFDAKYTLDLFNIIKIVPRFTARRQLPWNSAGTFLEFIDSDAYFNKAVDRYRGNLLATAKLVPGMQVTLGTDAYLDYAEVYLSPGGEYVGLNSAWGHNDSATTLFFNVAAFGELSLQTPIFNLTAGARYEFHSFVGQSFVPRVALTKSFGPLWGKLLVSGAFKPPGVENISLNPDVTPERTAVYEAEMGYDVTSKFTVSAALFSIDIRDPIVYFFDSETELEAYVNFPNTGSQGVELEAKMLETWGNFTVNYSFATNDGRNTVDLYDAGRDDVLRAIPGHKVTAAARLAVNSNLSVSPSIVFISDRYGWLGTLLDANGDVIPDEERTERYDNGDELQFPVEREPAVVLVNIALQYRDLFVEGLDAQIAVFNLLDQNYRYLQPYDGGKAPLPAASREVTLRLTYHFGL